MKFEQISFGLLVSWSCQIKYVCSNPLKLEVNIKQVAASVTPVARKDIFKTPNFADQVALEVQRHEAAGIMLHRAHFL